MWPEQEHRGIATRLRATVAIVSIAFAAGVPAAEEPTTTASARVAEAAEAYWQRILAATPELRTREGLPVERLPDFSFARVEADAAFADAWLGKLAAVDEAALGTDEWLTLEVLRWQLERDRERPRYFWGFFQIAPYSFAHSGLTAAFDESPVAAEEDRERYLRLAGELPQIADVLAANLETQRGKGILLPRPQIPAVVRLLGAFAADGEDNPIWVDDARLAGVPAEEVGRFRERLSAVLRDAVAPAFRALAGRLDQAYVDAAPAAVGFGNQPGGDEVYRYAIRLFTTLDVTPEEVHLLGLARMESLAAEMAALREKLGLPAAAAEANAVLRRDPRVLATSPEDVERRLMRPIERIEPLVERYFAAQPKARYGVARLDPSLEGSMTFGFYSWPTAERPSGVYFYNGSRLDERPLLNAAALIYHELIPGHHFQVALQGESTELPAFREVFFTSAFAEGWADYASELPREMGLYDDPLDLYGRLTSDLFLTSRLVVDTGMNALGWSREMAMTYLRERLLESETQIATETLRYAADVPAQALAYKLGSLKIWELRRRAEKALGASFDLRRFHDAVLRPGSLPLTVLERHLDRWIEAERSRVGRSTPIDQKIGYGGDTACGGR